MKSESTHTAHRQGRTASELPARRWPVVSRHALSDLQMSGEAPADWNSTVHATAKGYVYIANAELELRRLLRSTDIVLAERAGEILVTLHSLRDRWPIELV